MRRILWILLCLVLLSAGVSAADNEIDSLLAEVSVEENGSCRVTLTVQVSFADAPTSFTVPLGSEAGDITASGGTYRVKRIDGVRCAVFSNSSGFVGTQTFICSFSLPCAVEDEGSSQSFTLQLPEHGFDYSIQSFEMRLQFPAEVKAQPALHSAYYGDVVDNFLNIQVEGNTLSMRSVTAFKDRETLSLQLEFPPDSFDLRYLPGRITSFNQIAFYVLLLAAILYWAFRLRGRLLLPKKQVAPDMEACAGEIECQLYGRMPDVPAILAHWGNLGYVAIFRNDRGRIILRKQMEMGNERKASERKLFQALFRNGNTCDLLGQRFRSLCRPAAASIRSGWIRRFFRKNAGSPFILRAICILAAFFVCLMTFDLWLPASAWRWLFLPLLTVFSTALCILVQLSFRYVLHRRKLFYLTLGGCAAVLLWGFGIGAGNSGLMFLNLLVQILCSLVLLFGGKRTDAGREQVRQLLGLRRYLRRLEKDELHRLIRLDNQYFYRMLPFAEMLGVGRAFCKRFDHCSIEPCPWLSDAHIRPETTAEFYSFYREIFSAIRFEGLGDLLPKPVTSQKAGRR